jgi:DNA-binding NtrC family response regulator
MAGIAIIDDDPGTRRLLERALSGEGHETYTAESAEEGLAAVRVEKPDLVLLDFHLPDTDGLSAFKRLRAHDAKLPVIFITGDASGDKVIEALRAGAFDYLVKPLDLEHVSDVVERALVSRRLMTTPVALAPSDTPLPEDGAETLVGRSPEMIEVFRAIAQCARQTVPVLVRGESGVGKELVARAIYQHGDRAEEPFMAVNCATLSESLLESELFGHEKGAFTGASGRRVGKFEQCDGGTIFLDEIGDTPIEVQAKLLRVLQQQEFQRVGGNETIKTDVRIISATNRPLEEMCEEGSFRLDLLHRLRGFEVKIPPLRERRDDLQRLIEYMLARFQRDLELPEFEGVSPEALQKLLAHDWPGNVRELEATIRRGLIHMQGPVLTPGDLALTEAAAASAEDPGAPDGQSLGELIRRQLPGSTNLYAEVIEIVERELCEVVLAETRGNQSRAAEIMGITRGKLRSRIKSFDIDLEDLES